MVCVLSDVTSSSDLQLPSRLLQLCETVLNLTHWKMQHWKMQHY